MTRVSIEQIVGDRVTAQASPLMPLSNPIDRLYRLVVGDRVLGALLVLLALSVAAGILLPQAPSSLAPSDTTARWLAETSSRYGSLGGVLQSAGLFDVWHSDWFRGLVAVTAFVLLLRLGLAIGDAVKRLRNLDPVAAVREARRWPLHATIELDAESASVVAELSEVLLSEGWQIAQAESVSGTVIVAERSPWGLVAIPLFYAGILLALAGLWLGQLVGWSESNIALLPGQPVSLRHGQGLSISLAGEDTGPGELIIQSNKGTTVSGMFSPAGRVHLSGLTIRRTGQGRSLAVSVRDERGQALQLQSSGQPGPTQPVLDLVFDQPRAEQVFFVPARQLVVSVVAFPALPERGFAGPTFLVQAFRSGQREPVFNQFVEGDADLTVAGDALHLRSGPLVTVEIDRNPVAPLVIAGLALVVVGLLLALWRPAGRLALLLRNTPQGSAPSRLTSTHHGVSVEVSLQPSPAWRQAGRWLLAWTSTYGPYDS